MSRFIRTLATLLATLIIAAAGLLVAATAAQAADDPTLVAKAKTEITRRIDLRLDALRWFAAAVDAAKNLSDGHQASLNRIITQDQSGLTALKATVASETTLAALRVDAQSMINDYRVFLLVGPQVRLSIAGDAEQAAITRLRAVHDKLAGLVAAAKQSGKDTTAAEADLASMAASLDSASGHVAGQVDAVLAVQPGPDANAIIAALGAVRRALAAARIDLRAALASAHEVVAFLRSIQ